ncbi:Uncharacterised protein [Mycobacteroides abscessus subsp. abscessus]|uniref:hypothetical protein n=1 Tax=Mycobacteroides abscessus TaxID=36809 RepID=UPI0009A8D308|nr:hypothetical protein [Mycobacteroides abscessus]SLJ67389.1 Uncharacterised protein [Mycobacteroides abscessus subsp. abscessus]
MTRRKRIAELERELGEISAEIGRARDAGDDSAETTLIKDQKSIVQDLVALHQPLAHSRRQLSLAQASVLAAVFALALMAGLLLFVTGHFR